MAIDIQNSNYGGKVLESILTLASTGNEIVERGLVHIIPGIRDKVSVPRLFTSEMLQKVKEMPTSDDSKGEFKYDEKFLEPQEFMAYTEFNPKVLNHIWRKWQPKGNLVFDQLPPNVQTEFLEALAKQIKFELGWHYINSTLGDSDKELFNGLVYRIKNDEDVIVANCSAVSMVGKLYTLYSQIPTVLLNDPRLRILMSKKEFQRYDRELTNQISKGVNHTDISQRSFKGIPIEDMANWPADFLVATMCSMDEDSNLFVAVNLKDDADVILIDKVSNAGEKYFFKLKMMVDTNIALGQECTVLNKVAPQITADVTALEFALAGGEEMVTITATEEYVVESIPDGFTATEYETGLLISADSNEGSTSAIADEIVIALKEHTSRKLCISVAQPTDYVEEVVG